jgi:hypothetical protein
MVRIQLGPDSTKPIAGLDSVNLDPKKTLLARAQEGLLIWSANFVT